MFLSFWDFRKPWKYKSIDVTLRNRNEVKALKDQKEK